MIRVLIVASVRLYREGLHHALGQRPGIAVIGTSPNATQALADATALHPDVVVMDISTPGGATTIQQMMATDTHCRVVGVAVSDSEEDIVRCVKAGICGYVPVDGSLNELVTAIESATRDEMICPPRITAALARCVARLGPANPVAASLTYREREIVDLVYRGRSNKEIAQQLHLATATVKNHVHHVLRKLGARKRGELAVRVGFRSITFTT